MTELNPKVDKFLEKAQSWQAEYRALRAIALDSGLTESFKWGKPCYTLEDKNIFLIHGFKNFCALLFFKGALLPDPMGILVAQTENTQATRQIRFTDIDEIIEMESVLKGYIRQAIEAEKAGLEVQFKETEEFAMPAEFTARLAEDPDLKGAFEALPPGRQRGYLLHFAGAKQAKTRAARIDKNRQRILEGKGLNDR